MTPGRSVAGGRARVLITRWLPLAFAGGVALLLVAGMGARLQMIYPLAALAVGIAIEWRGSAAAYVAFTLWLWALTPFVRRVADFQGGWHEPSIILLTPYLVTAAPAIRLAFRMIVTSLRTRPRLAGSAMFALTGFGVAFGLPMGFVATPTGAVVETLNWGVPIAFGFYIASRRQDVAQIERAMAVTFMQAAVVMGAYAVYQFMRAPAWDVDWMLNIEATSFGIAREFELRVFSTSHSPGVLGYFIIIPLALWVANPRLRTVGAAALAGVALALSQVRAAWLGLAVASVMAVYALPGRARLRLAAFIGMGMVVAAPFVLPIEISDVTLDRMLTIANLGNDESALSRLAGHTLLISFLNEHPFGIGIGMVDRRLEQLIGSRDSIIVGTVVQFGIIGALAYAAGLVALIARIVGYYRRARTSEALGLSCAGLGLLSALFFGTVTAGPPGVLLWAIAGLATASRPKAHARAWAAAPARAPVRRSGEPQPVGAVYAREALGGAE
jgi:hypothetical protein